MRAVTPLGWAVSALAILALGIGLALGWWEMLALGVLLLAVVVGAVAQSWGSTTYDVDVDLAARRVRQGDRVFGRVRISNVSRRRVPPSTLELPVGEAVASFAVPGLSPRTEHEATFRVPTQRRAVIPVGPAASVRGDAVGLVRRRRTWSDLSEIVVHPRTIALGSGASGQLRDLDGEATRSLAEASLAFHALREYTPGDDVRRIHWRSTARTGKVLVRQDEDVRRTRVVVVLATAPAPSGDPEAFELAVQVAASWAVQARRLGHDLSLHAGRLVSADTAVRVLDAFAAVSVTPDGLDERAAATWVARRHPDASLVVLVTGDGASPAALRSCVAMMPPTAMRVAVACAPGEVLEVSAGEGRAIARCGELGQLPRLVRRVLG